MTTDPRPIEALEQELESLRGKLAESPDAALLEEQMTHRVLGERIVLDNILDTIVVLNRQHKIVYLNRSVNVPSGLLAGFATVGSGM